ncbi:LacI family DNA-binding transcriptional regulator [Gracilibacillus sp. YIM 98692]|uniref:LacI family DNA-binding transcriptional regulator n=1 Tax=Gracilibacillus sp. YIM 98692 TaxID=2663532 RepID=UPI0013D49014|nr:LacI family DNA-binding transcriptional regulator [Gracilibacillus sp. YIM 98692]
MKLTITDIARLANVSISSVSLALNNKPGLAQETREKILKIAEANGYVVKNNFAQNKNVVNRSDNIIKFVACTNPGIVIEEYESLPFFTELINNIGKYLFSKDYSLMLSNINMDNLHEDIKLISKEGGCDGIILLGTDLNEEQIEFIAKHQPNIVVLDNCFDTLNVSFVNMNSMQGAYQATKYLIEAGHKRIGYVKSKVRIRNFELRKEGFMKALNQNNLKLLDKDILTMIPTVLSSQEVFKKKIDQRRDDLPTAVFCESDYMAISFIKSLSEVGLKIPNDVSVVGFDDIQEAKILTPELSSISVDKEKMATLAVDKIIELMNNPQQTRVKYIVDTELIVRNSTQTIEQHTSSTE